MSSQNIPKYLQQEEALTQECKELMANLPRQNGWFSSSYLYLYEGFWYQPNHLQAVIACEKHFQVQDSDVFLVTYPKCGTTWLKAIIFTLLNRKHYPVADKNHPLLTRNPHDLVLSLEINLYADNQTPDPASFPSRRFFSTHMPHVSLPPLAKASSKCKLVYACRNPKDTFVSLWHFMNKLRPQETVENEIGEMFEMFCKGVVGYGPFWDHVVEYWKQSGEDPDRVFFLKYEDMKEEPVVLLRRLAEFLGCPFSADEEESGVVEKILKLTSFDSMKSLEVNRIGRLSNGMENRFFFREGVVGDWEKYLSAEMIEKLDGIMQQKLFGSGLVL